MRRALLLIMTVLMAVAAPAQRDDGRPTHRRGAGPRAEAKASSGEQVRRMRTRLDELRAKLQERRERRDVAPGQQGHHRGGARAGRDGAPRFDGARRALGRHPELRRVLIERLRDRARDAGPSRGRGPRARADRSPAGSEGAPRGRQPRRADRTV